MTQDTPSNQELYRIAIETREAQRIHIERSDKWREDTGIKMAIASERTKDLGEEISSIVEKYSSLALDVARIQNKIHWVAGLCAAIGVIGLTTINLYINSKVDSRVDNRLEEKLSQALERYEIPIPVNQ